MTSNAKAGLLFFGAIVVVAFLFGMSVGMLVAR